MAHEYHADRSWGHAELGACDTGAGLGWPGSELAASRTGQLEACGPDGWLADEHADLSCGPAEPDGPDTETAGLRHKERRGLSVWGQGALCVSKKRIVRVPLTVCLVVGGVRLGCLFLVPTSLRFRPSAHVLGMCKGCRHVVSYSGQNCASKVLKQKLHKNHHSGG